MSTAASAGDRLWQALEAERPSRVVETINALGVLLVEQADNRLIRPGADCADPALQTRAPLEAR